MKNLKFLLIQTMLMLWISIPSLAQQHTIKVWPEVVPGAIGNRTFQSSRVIALPSAKLPNHLMTLPCQILKSNVGSAQ